MDRLNMVKVEKHTTSPSNSSPFREVMNSLLGRRRTMVCRDRLFSGASMSPMITPMKLFCSRIKFTEMLLSLLWNSYSSSQIGITFHGVETEIMTVRKRSTQKSNICIPEIWRPLISEQRMWAIHISQERVAANIFVQRLQITSALVWSPFYRSKSQNSGFYFVTLLYIITDKTVFRTFFLSLPWKNGR